MDKEVLNDKWEKRFLRERMARNEAEKLLEEKSLALFNRNEQLISIKENLEALVKIRTSELENALNKAEQANIAKRDFFATVSHELRTPLNGILGMTNLLNDTNLNNIQKDFVHTILVSSEILLNLINDILDFSKIEAGKLELEQIEFNLNKCLFEVLDILSARVNEKGLNFYIETEDQIPVNLIGDPNKLKQILINLGGNAIKFTEKGEIALKVSLKEISEKKCTLFFEIKDTGIGIPQEKIERLFQPFTQADASTSRKFGGTGLGLSICKKLVELMGGEVSLDSILGMGSNFQFSASFLKAEPRQSEPWEGNNLLNGYEIILIEKSVGLSLAIEKVLKSWGLSVLTYQSIHEAAPQKNKQQKILLIGAFNEQELLLEPNLPAFLNSFEYKFLLSKNKESHLTNKAKILGFDALIFKPIKPSYLFNELCAALKIELVPEKQVTSYFEEPNVKTESIKILIVEDNLINQKVAAAMLAKFGYQAKIAGNGIIALQMMYEESFDLIFMDFQMPELDGYETTLRIRAGQFGKCKPNIPIIAMTANAMKGDEEKCLEAGMNDFLSKPLIQKELQEMLAKWRNKINK
jgi:signal transduction histidine kinase/CheY-like chemotaxis protein